MATPEFCMKIGRRANRDFERDLYQRFENSIPARVDGACDAITTGMYLQPILQYLETVVAEMASGYSATRWLWYLRRLPTFIFEGNLSTTLAYDSSLAETASAMAVGGADNLRVHGNSLRYAVDSAVVKRLLRFCYTIRRMSEVQRLLRFAGKGISFRFTPKEPLPSPTPSPEEDESIRLYDKRIEADMLSFPRGGTKLIEENHEAKHGALLVYRMLPKWHPSFIGKGGQNQQQI